MVVLGHSGTTGFGSDPTQPDVDVRENSWATGSNPEVRSVYQRLVATHPALEGHATSVGVDGSFVEDLGAQVQTLLFQDPLPDLGIIQTIDYDIRCDGTDAANVKKFGRTLDRVLDSIYRHDPHVQVFFVDQWGSVDTYARAARAIPSAVAGSSGTGLCDIFTPDGRVRSMGVASLQRIVDAYFRTVQRVCAAHQSCWTDGGALQRMPVHPDDLTADANHLSIQGQAVMAAYAWDALPDAIKNRS